MMMPKSRKRKQSNFQHIQARNRKARAYARMEERHKLKEEAAASKVTSEESVNEPKKGGDGHAPPRHEPVAK